MGYEVKLFLVEKRDVTPLQNSVGATYCNVVAFVALSKIGSGKVADLDAEPPAKPEAYIYGLDGNTEIMEDCYGANLRVRDPKDVLAALRTDNKRDNCRRYDMAIALLAAAIPKFGHELKVIFYAH